MFDNVLEIHTKSLVHLGAQLNIKIPHNHALPKGREKGLATRMILTEAVTGAINPQASLWHQEAWLQTVLDSLARTENMTPAVTASILTVFARCHTGQALLE